MAERYVYVLNVGETASTALNYTYAQRGDAFPDKAFSNCPVNPIIKTTGTESEELGTDFYDSNQKRVKTMPYRDNYGYFFSSGSNTWHGMEKKRNS